MDAKKKEIDGCEPAPISTESSIEKSNDINLTHLKLFLWALLEMVALTYKRGLNNLFHRYARSHGT